MNKGNCFYTELTHRFYLNRVDYISIENRILGGLIYENWDYGLGS